VKLKQPLPKWAPLAGIAVAGLLVLFVGWKVVVSPQSSKASDLKSRAADVRQQVTEQLAQVAAAKSAAAAPAQTIKVADVYKLAKAMPSNRDVPDILIELSQVTKDAGVELKTLSPTDAGTEPTVPISLDVEGDFYTVTDLLYRLRNLVYVRDGELEANGRLFTIDSVSFSPVGRKIDASILLHAYVYGAAAATPAPVTTPAGTDTTATTTTSTDTTSTTPGGPSAAGAP
jgi:hypothetical protein